MKRAALIVTLLAIASWAAAQGGQSTQNPPTQNPPSGGQAPQGSQPAQGTQAGGQGAPGAQPAPPAGKRPLQAKTQPEYDAYKAAVATADPAALEKAADDFATKFPDSELRAPLYKSAMRLYQNANNRDKLEAMGRKVLNVDPDDPEALIMVAEVIAGKTKDTDLDRDQRYDEAMKMANKALSTIDTDINPPPGTTPEKLEAYKSGLRSEAYMVLGSVEFNKSDYAAAQTDLQKSIDAYPAEPDAVTVLRLAISLDRQGKYAEALKVANRAVDLTQETSQIGTVARRERDRLQQLTGGTAAPATQPQSQPPQN